MASELVAKVKATMGISHPDLNPGNPNRPNPRSGFETELIRELDKLVTALSPNVASLKVSRIRRHPEWDEAYFDVTPTNVQAARMQGYAVYDDLLLTVGRSEREFLGFGKSGTVFPGMGWTDELHLIWNAVLAGGFSELQTLSSSGEVIGAWIELDVRGMKVAMGNGRRESLFRKPKRNTIIYESYFL